MVKNIEDLKRHLITIIDIQFNTFDFALRNTLKRFQKVVHLIEYCYGYIDCWCSINDKRESLDDLRNYINNYIMDSVNVSFTEVED